MPGGASFARESLLVSFWSRASRLFNPAVTRVSPATHRVAAAGSSAAGATGAAGQIGAAGAGGMNPAGQGGPAGRPASPESAKQEAAARDHRRRWRRSWRRGRRQHRRRGRRRRRRPEATAAARARRDRRLTGAAGAAPTACTLPNHSGNGSFTNYSFSQGTFQQDTSCIAQRADTRGPGTQTRSKTSPTRPAKNTYFAAIPGQNEFDSKVHCGECVLITGQNGKQIIATIIDECPYGSGGQNGPCVSNPNGHLDLSVDAFNQLGYPTGNPSGTNWKYVPCPVTGNLIARVNPAIPTSSSSRTRSSTSRLSRARPGNPTAPGTSAATSPASSSSSPIRQTGR